MRLLIAAVTLSTCVAAQAAGPADILQGYASQARKASPSFKEFSAASGQRFYGAQVKHSSGRQMSCATCHSADPRGAGRHERTGKEIAPLAPAANKERISDAANVEKWFKRNCRDVLERDCSLQEKGDFIAFLLSIK
jgi:hypothetical protein